MSQALQSRTQKSTATRNHVVDFSGSLEDDEYLTGTPTVTSSAGLALTNKQVTSAMKKINGKRVPARKAVAFTAAGTPGTYTIEILCGTTSDPAEIVDGTLTLTVTP